MTRTNKDFEKVILMLSYLDAIVSGAQLRGFTAGMTNGHVEVLKNLIHQALGTSETEFEFDPYIQLIFRTFLESKKDLIFNYYNLTRRSAIPWVLDLILYKINKGEYDRGKDDDTKNLFKPLLLDLFVNVKSITLITKYHWYYDKAHCSLSLDLLLSMMKETKNKSLKQVLILKHVDDTADSSEDEGYYDENRKEHKSWPAYIWRKRQWELKFRNTDFDLEFKSHIGPNNDCHGIVITKKQDD